MTVSPDTARFAAFLGGLALFFALETLAAHRAWHAPRWKRLAVHVLLAGTSALLVRVTVAVPLALLVGEVRDRGIGLAPLLGLTGPLEIVLSLLVLDLFDYWWHRANHAVPFLWRFHKAHHSDTHVDVTTALRFHPGEIFLSAPAKLSWIVIWGPSLWAFALFEIAVTLAAQFHHANIDFPDPVERWVRPLLVTPRMHASHHSAWTRSLMANYSTILSVWDPLFGSWVRPDPEHLGDVGLPYARERDLDVRHVLAMPLHAEPARATSESP